MNRRPRIVIWDNDEWSKTALADLREHADVLKVRSADDAVKLLIAGECDGLMMGDESALGLQASFPGGISDRNHQQVLDYLVSGIAVVHPDLSLDWCNRAFEEMCGGERAAGAGLVEALGCPEPASELTALFAECQQSKCRVSTRLSLPTGRHFELSAQPLPPSGDACARILCVVRDTTFEVQQQQKLLAIHRAGIELGHLTPDELAKMSTVERLELLKANILQYSLNILNFKSFEIRLLVPETKLLRILITEGMTHHATERELYAREQGNGVTGFVASTGKSYLCADVRIDPLYIPGADDARSSLTVPVVYRDQIIGTFNVESPEAKHFTDSDRDFLEVFAREIAVGLNTLDLLRAEKSFGGRASVEAILGEVGLPADEIVADSIAILGYLDDVAEKGNPAHDAIRRVLINARAIKSSIQSTRERIERSFRGTDLAPARLAGKRFLLADSDPEIRRSAHLMLGKVHCEVDTAKTAREAIALAQNIRYDVILGDIRLPDLNGYDFFRRIKQTAPSTPVVLMTGFGYDASHCIVNARQEGLGGVLYKPFRLDRLCETLEDALDPARHARRPQPVS